MATVLTEQMIRDMCSAIADGTRVRVSYYHVRAPDTDRLARGVITKKIEANSVVWIVRQSSTSSVRIPNADLQVQSIEIATAASSSRPREDDEEVQPSQTQPPATEALRAAQTAAMQVHRVAAHAAIDPAQLIDLFRSQMDSQAKFFEQQSKMQFNNFQTQMNQMQQSQERLAEELRRKNATQVPPPPQAGPTDDVERLMRFGDAIRGQDNPQWRLAPGLLLPFSMPPRFMIFSIPHLIHRVDCNGMMVRMAKGTALQAYLAMKADCKMQFQGQVLVRHQVRNDKGKQSDSNLVENSSGVRAQIERAERMFADLLNKIDQLDTHELPATKTEWMIFLDAGVAVLELYATLANGFIKGGAKVSASYEIAITTTGRFDPTKLWQNDSKSESSDSFRR